MAPPWQPALLLPDTASNTSRCHSCSLSREAPSASGIMGTEEPHSSFLCPPTSRPRFLPSQPSSSLVPFKRPCRSYRTGTCLMGTRKVSQLTAKSHPRFLKCVLKRGGVALQVGLIEWVLYKACHQKCFHYWLYFKVSFHPGEWFS